MEEDHTLLDSLDELDTLRRENHYYKEQLALAHTKIKTLKKVSTNSNIPNGTQRLAVEHKNQRESLDCILKVRTKCPSIDHAVTGSL